MRVLVVDDERAVRGLFSVALERVGHKVDVAGSASETLALVAQEAYDVIFLDVILGPGGNGFEVFDELERLGIGSRIILMTGRPMDDIQQKYVERAAGVLMKPIDGLHRIISAVNC